MFTTVTVKIEAETKGELIDSFGGSVKLLKGHFEQLKKDAVFGPPDKVIVRYLIMGGQWRGAEEQKAPPAKAERKRGKPDVE